jgi:hypothetical protein
VRASQILLAGALLASAFGLAACGSVKRELDPVAAAATKTDEGGVKLTMTVTAAAGGRSYTLTGQGAFDDDQGTMTLNVASLGEATIDYLTENGHAVVYLMTPKLGSELPGGKKWIRLDLQAVGKSLGIGSLAGPGASAMQNPADALQLLEQSGSYPPVGTETVDGVSTPHYRGTIDLQKAAAASGVGDAVKRLLQAGAPTQFPLDVWIDDNGYLRQVKESYTSTEGGKRMSESVTLGLGDYGTQVSVSAPPSDEVFDATQLATQFASGTTTNG